MKYIKSINEYSSSNTIWYHGTPDSREVEKLGFVDKTLSVEYVSEPLLLKAHQEKMNIARKNGDDNTYFKLLDDVANFKKIHTFKKPIFLSDNYSVAKTYANPKRAFDYQNAVEKVFTIDCENCNKIVKISAFGDRFRFISVEKVKEGFINSGISEEEIDKCIDMFNFYVKDNAGIKTDTIAAIADYLGFDCVDVMGVLDSYEGGTLKSTVRMVLSPEKLKIK